MSREKTENPSGGGQLTSKPRWTGLFGLTSQQLHQMTWNALNFTTVAGITSASIVSVQSPARTVLANLSMNGTFMPPVNGGFLAVARFLYAGTWMSLKGSGVRSVYVTSVKNNKPVEGISEESAASVIREEEMLQEGRMQRLSKNRMGFVASVAFGDMLVTQVPGSYSTLRKIPGLMPKDFKWYTPHNLYHLMKGGFLPGYTGGLVNFAALCVLEPYIAMRIGRNMHIENNKAQHFFAGALSGSLAAFFSYPFAVACDYTIVRATITNGQLSSRSTLSIAKEISSTVKSNPKQAIQTFFGNAAKQLPIRMGLTAIIYSIVSGVGETLGPEPLKAVVPERYQPGRNSQGFFGKTSAPEEVSSVESTHSSTHVTPQEPPKGP